MLLPYIEDSQLSIVCINIILGGDKVSVEAVRPRGISSGSKSKYRPDVKRSGSIHR